MNLLQMNTSMWYPWKWTHHVSTCIYQAAMNTLLSKWTQKWWRLTNAFNRQKNYCNKIYKTYWKYEHVKMWVKNIKKISAKRMNLEKNEHTKGPRLLEIYNKKVETFFLKLTFLIHFAKFWARSGHENAVYLF